MTFNQPTFICPHCGTVNEMGPISLPLASLYTDGKAFTETCMNVEGAGCGRKVDVHMQLQPTITTRKIEGEEKNGIQ